MGGVLERKPETNSLIDIDVGLRSVAAGPVDKLAVVFALELLANLQSKRKSICQQNYLSFFLSLSRDH